MRLIFTITAALLAASATVAHPQTHGAEAQAAALAPSARPAAAVVDAFHAALRRGDTSAARSHLAVNALIYESGGVERGKQEYASHHLGADATFAQAVPSTITRRAGEAVGIMAWIATEGRTAGTYKGRALDLVTTETMVLRRVGNGWKIVHIHWSSGTGS
jgi:ketosteroid isomerase-like protein